MNGAVGKSAWLWLNASALYRLKAFQSRLILLGFWPLKIIGPVLWSIDIDCRFRHVDCNDIVGQSLQQRLGARISRQMSKFGKQSAGENGRHTSATAVLGAHCVMAIKGIDKVG